MLGKLAAVKITKTQYNELDLSWRLKENKIKDELKPCIAKLLESLSNKKEFSVSIGNETFKIDPSKFYLSDLRMETRNNSMLRQDHNITTGDCAKAESCG
jgi:hypothetical protein